MVAGEGVGDGGVDLGVEDAGAQSLDDAGGDQLGRVLSQAGAEAGGQVASERGVAAVTAETARFTDPLIPAPILAPQPHTVTAVRAPKYPHNRLT